MQQRKSNAKIAGSMSDIIAIMFIIEPRSDDKATQIARAQQSLPNGFAAIRGALNPYQHELFGVVVEFTYNSCWLVDELQATGYSLHLANTTAIKQYDGLKHRYDESDARHLAHIGAQQRTGQLMRTDGASCEAGPRSLWRLGMLRRKPGSASETGARFRPRVNVFMWSPISMAPRQPIYVEKGTSEQLRST
jgi:hypothetical protein